jgi:hypothetical protein
MMIFNFIFSCDYISILNLYGSIWTIVKKNVVGNILHKIFKINGLPLGKHTLVAYITILFRE